MEWEVNAENFRAACDTPAQATAEQEFESVFESADPDHGA
jgi:hypothetical protein